MCLKRSIVRYELVLGLMDSICIALDRLILKGTILTRFPLIAPGEGWEKREQFCAILSHAELLPVDGASASSRDFNGLIFPFCHPSPRL